MDGLRPRGWYLPLTPSPTYPVMNRIFVSGCREATWVARVRPPIFGITTSVSIRWIGSGFCDIRSRASLPLEAAMTLYPASSRASLTSTRTGSASSTTRIVSRPGGASRTSSMGSLAGTSSVKGSQIVNVVPLFGSLSSRMSPPLWRDIPVFPGDGCVQLGIRGFDGDPPPLRHGIPCIQHQVDDDLLDLPRIRLHSSQPIPRDRHELDVIPDQTAEHLVHVGYDAVQIQDLGLEDLLAAEGDQLLRQTGGALARFPDLFESPGHERGVFHAFLHQSDIARDHRHQVVEIVGDPARKPSHRLDFLGLPQLLLQLLSPGDVASKHLEGRLSEVIDRYGRYFQFHGSSVQPDIFLLKCRNVTDLFPFHEDPVGSRFPGVRVEDIRNRFSEEFQRGACSQKAHSRGVDEGDLSVLLDVDRFRRKLHQVAVAPLALPEVVFHPLPFQQDDDGQPKYGDRDEAVEDRHILPAWGGGQDKTETDQKRASHQEQVGYPARRQVGGHQKRDQVK